MQLLKSDWIFLVHRTFEYKMVIYVWVPSMFVAANCDPYSGAMHQNFNLYSIWTNTRVEVLVLIYNVNTETGKMSFSLPLVPLPKNDLIIDS